MLLGRSDEGLKAELGGIIASFKFSKNIKKARLIKKLGSKVRQEARLDCLKIEDLRHKITLYLWENGKVVVENATHANLVAMAAVYWQEKLEKEGIFEESAIDSEDD